MTSETSTDPDTPRGVADAYVQALAELDPAVATSLGLRAHDDRVPDFSVAGHQAQVDLALSTLGDLEDLKAPAEGWDEVDRRCERLLRDRLGVIVDAHEAHEHLREVRNLFAPPQQTRQLFSMMPTQTEEDW